MAVLTRGAGRETVVDGRGYDLKRGGPWIWNAKIEIELNVADVSATTVWTDNSACR
jgi:hypothetical protein